MTTPPLIYTYTAPRVRRGDRVHCLYRDAECVVTGMHDGPLPWPRWTPANGGWTAAEVKLLRGKLTDAEIAAKLGRSVASVRTKRWRASK